MRSPFLASIAALAAVAVLATACSSDNSSSSSATDGDSQTIAITLSDAGCEPKDIPAKAGPTTFEVENSGTAAVTEFEVLDGSHILGEVENVIPGSKKSFSLTLKEGTYTTKCPGGSSFEEGALNVSGTAAGAVDPEANAAAVAQYTTYVQDEVTKLAAAVTPFVAAVKAGDTEGAKQTFAAARYHYESVEPVAESFGDLDPAIDAREGDVPEAEWGGFHRIEKALWVDGDVSDMGPVADKLVADIADLQAKVGTLTLEPAQIANGAVELLNEISVSKITGEEDRYSHTDLSDFAGNLAGSNAAYQSVSPLLTGSDAQLKTTVGAQFVAVQKALDAYEGTEPVGNGYVLYDTLTPQDTQSLSASVDSLAEPMSQVAAAVLS